MAGNQFEKLTVVKVGGAILEDAASLSGFLDRFVALPGLKILVHGGGRAATKLAERLGVESKLVEGRRVTDAETLEIVTMVYGGLVNKKTVAGLQARGCNAAGFTGADLNLVKARKRALAEIDYGFVGDIAAVNLDAFAHLLQLGIIPVVAPLTHDGDGQLLNTNADTMASAIAIAMSSRYEVSLVFCFEKPGVLLNADDDTSVIPQLSSGTYQSYKEQKIIHSGMIPKIDNSFLAIQQGVKKVIITNAVTLDINAGTKILL
jgi:acetylglutamate kinase